MTEQWQELKETIIEMRDNDGTGTQQETCKFLANYMDILEKQMPEPKIWHCKECKYFEYDSVAKVDGMPLIVAHEICSKWGDGCKTKEDGYCFLFKPQESEDKEENDKR